MTIKTFDVVDIISAKRDNLILNTEQINWVIKAYSDGIVADEQMSALAMAIYLQGMNRREITDWTKAMINSGSTLSFASIDKKTVDKHSTGGVGDKITLPLAPLVASFGVAVPQLSGRGLGFTGGTLDKLESIKNWNANLTFEKIEEILKSDVSAVICAATDNLVPADKKLYALRDTTATVSCIPLIASSIMSKKIAEGTSALLLDVKCGSGAFMNNFEEAQELARVMVDLGTDANVTTRALITDMNTPLGNTVGNALEIRETLEVLAGGGPKDIIELTVAFATEMLDMVGISSIDVAANLKNGKAMDQWNKMIMAQNGDIAHPLPTAKETLNIIADESGFITKLDAKAIAISGWRLGVGRVRKEDTVQAAAGIEIHAKLGDYVTKGAKILTLHTNDADRFDHAVNALENAYFIGKNKPALKNSLILDKIV